MGSQTIEDRIDQLLESLNDPSLSEREIERIQQKVELLKEQRQE